MSVASSASARRVRGRGSRSHGGVAHEDVEVPEGPVRVLGEELGEDDADRGLELDEVACRETLSSFPRARRSREESLLLDTRSACGTLFASFSGRESSFLYASFLASRQGEEKGRIRLSARARARVLGEGRREKLLESPRRGRVGRRAGVGDPRVQRRELRRAQGSQQHVRGQPAFETMPLRAASRLFFWLLWRAHAVSSDKGHASDSRAFRSRARVPYAAAASSSSNTRAACAPRRRDRGRARDEVSRLASQKRERV